MDQFSNSFDNNGSQYNDKTIGEIKEKIKDLPDKNKKQYNNQVRKIMNQINKLFNNKCDSNNDNNDEQNSEDNANNGDNIKDVDKNKIKKKLKCEDYPYNINDFETYSNVPKTSNIRYKFWYDCVLKNKLISDNYLPVYNNISDINTQINDYNEYNNNNLSLTFDELNNNSMYYYKTDLIYVICKISFFIVLIISYIYFFKLTGIIEPLKTLINKIISKGNSFINKEAAQIKKEPTIKPTDVKPTNIKPTIVKSTDIKPTIVKPTNVIQSNIKPIIKNSNKYSNNRYSNIKSRNNVNKM
jgi:hypothetical protein